MARDDHRAARCRRRRGQRVVRQPSASADVRWRAVLPVRASSDSPFVPRRRAPAAARSSRFPPPRRPRCVITCSQDCPGVIKLPTACARTIQALRPAALLPGRVAPRPTATVGASLATHERNIDLGAIDHCRPDREIARARTRAPAVAALVAARTSTPSRVAIISGSADSAEGSSGSERATASGSSAARSGRSECCVSTAPTSFMQPASALPDNLHSRFARVIVTVRLVSTVVSEPCRSRTRRSTSSI